MERRVKGETDKLRAIELEFRICQIMVYTYSARESDEPGIAGRDSLGRCAAIVARIRYMFEGKKQGMLDTSSAHLKGKFILAFGPLNISRSTKLDQRVFNDKEELIDVQ